MSNLIPNREELVRRISIVIEHIASKNQAEVINKDDLHQILNCLIEIPEKDKNNGYSYKAPIITELNRFIIDLKGVVNKIELDNIKKKQVMNDNKFIPKFRYVFADKENDIKYLYVTLQNIEDHEVDSFKFKLGQNYENIGIDKFIGMQDILGNDIYENDIDDSNWMVSAIENDSNSDGLELGWYLQRDNFESYQLIAKGQEISIKTNIYEYNKMYGEEDSI